MWREWAEYSNLCLNYESSSVCNWTGTRNHIMKTESVPFFSKHDRTTWGWSAIFVTFGSRTDTWPYVANIQTTEQCSIHDLKMMKIKPVHQCYHSMFKGCSNGKSASFKHQTKSSWTFCLIPEDWRWCSSQGVLTFSLQSCPSNHFHLWLHRLAYLIIWTDLWYSASPEDVQEVLEFHPFVQLECLLNIF